MKTIRTLLGFVLALALVQPPTSGKCISLQLPLKGKIEGATKGVKVIVGATSLTEGDAVSDIRQESSIEESHFRVLAWFNTTSNLVSEETCDRRPGVITVKLMRGDHVLDHRTLAVETTFRLTKKGDYELKEPITLHTAGG